MVETWIVLVAAVSLVFYLLYWAKINKKERLKEEELRIAQELEKQKKRERTSTEEHAKDLERIREAGIAVINAEMEMKRNQYLDAIARDIDEKRANMEREHHEKYMTLLNERDKIKEEIVPLKATLDDFQAKRDAINESLMRDKKMKMEKDFHRIILSEEAKTDIAYLTSIESKVHNKQVLRKLIYEVYLRPAVIEMEKRVLANLEFSGVYRITDPNGQCYIGQGVNIKNRWQQHVKASLGLDGIAHQHIHTIIKNYGWDLMTWEVLEKCPRANLNEKEKFYIEFYDSKNLGYNKRM